MSSKDSEQAFPRGGFSGPGGYGRPTNGMTLRDWFAGQALTGMCADATATEELMSKEMASWCYDLADAMLEARK